jgi:phosphomannomutase
MTRMKRSGGTRPGRAGAGRPAIAFGTSGWRGVLGEEVTFPRVRAAVAGALQWLEEQAGPPRRRVLVGFDARFASERMARMAAASIRQRGLSPVLSDRPVATPVVTAQVARRRALGALVFTASHNPPEHHGMKVFCRAGACVDDTAARRIEALAGRALAHGEAPAEDGLPRPVDLVSDYMEALLGLLDRRAIRRAAPIVVYDAMHGMGGGLLDEGLVRCGAKVEGLRLGPDPLFGGTTPDPIAERLGELARRVRRGRGLRLGLATDGDGDRLAGVDASGHPLSETQMVALLVDHLAATGRLRRGVVISRATGSLVEAVARDHGLPVVRRGMGFKHLSGALASGEADAAGDESGGFAFGRMGRDKDGIVAGCLLTEMLCLGGEPLAARLRRLERRHGAFRCGRRAIGRDARVEEGLAGLFAAPPVRVAGAPVRRVEAGDGLHLALDDGFLMWRASGTEAVVRVYAEAPTAQGLARRLDWAVRRLRRAAGPSGR